MLHVLSIVVNAPVERSLTHLVLLSDVVFMCTWSLCSCVLCSTKLLCSLAVCFLVVMFCVVMQSVWALNGCVFMSGFSGFVVALVFVLLVSMSNVLHCLLSLPRPSCYLFICSFISVFLPCYTLNFLLYLFHFCVLPSQNTSQAGRMLSCLHNHRPFWIICTRSPWISPGACYLQSYLSDWMILFPGRSWAIRRSWTYWEVVDHVCHLKDTEIL